MGNGPRPSLHINHTLHPQPTRRCFIILFFFFGGGGDGGGGGRQGERASSSYFYHGFHFRFSSSSSVLCVSKQGRERMRPFIRGRLLVCVVAQMDKALAGGVGLHGETHYPESKVDWAIGLLILASVPVWVTGVLLYCACLCLWGDWVRKEICRREEDIYLLFC